MGSNAVFRRWISTAHRFGHGRGLQRRCWEDDDEVEQFMSHPVRKCAPRARPSNAQPNSRNGRGARSRRTTSLGAVT